MKPKRIIQIVLLLFIAVSVAYFVAQETSRSVAGVPAEHGPQASLAGNAQPAKVVAYYFHGNFRCVSCRKLESVSKEAVMNGFQAELKRGELRWAAVNVEQSGNEHFIADYRLFSRSLVIVRYRNGQQVEYKNLMKAWELLRDDEALKKYVQSEVRSFLQES